MFSAWFLCSSCEATLVSFSDSRVIVTKICKGEYHKMFYANLNEGVEKAGSVLPNLTLNVTLLESTID